MLQSTKARQTGRMFNRLAALPEMRIIAAQVLTTILVAALCALLGTGGLSALLGGFCVILPNLYLALRNHLTTSPSWSVVVVAEAQKLLFMAALFAIIFFLFRPLDVLEFFGTLILCQAVFLVAAIRFGAKPL